MTFLIVFYIMCTGELCIVLVYLAGSLLSMYQVVAWEHAFVMTSYADSDSYMSIMCLV